MNKEKILLELLESGKIKAGKEDFLKQSIPQKVFWSVWAVEMEVNNGGFKQYFFNSSRKTAGFVVQALTLIGAFHTADICKRAIACAFPEGLPASHEAIQSASVDFSEQKREELGTYDDEFYTYPDNLTDLLYAYAVCHPEEFGPLPMAGLLH